MHFSGCILAVKWYMNVYVYAHLLTPQAMCQCFHSSNVRNGQNTHMAQTSTVQGKTNCGPWMPCNTALLESGKLEHKARGRQTQKEWKKPDHTGGSETNLWRQQAKQRHPSKGGHWIKLQGIFWGLQMLFLSLTWVLVTGCAHFAPNAHNLFTLLYVCSTSTKI